MVLAVSFYRACVAITCPGTSLNCDNAFANGCETDGTSLANCGSCGNVCPNRANAVRTCTGTPRTCGFTCDTGFYDVNGVASDGCEAKKCPAGTFSGSGYYPATSTPEASCTRCPAGTYSSTVGANSANTCTRCAAGTYSSALGATSDATCTPCAAGSASSAVGADSAATCTLCPIKFWSAAGAPSCTSCGAGKTTAWKGSDDAGDCVDAASDVGAWDVGFWGMTADWYSNPVNRAFDTAARWIWSSLPGAGPTYLTKENEIAILTRQFEVLEAQSGVPLEIFIAADNAAHIFIDGVFLATGFGGWPGSGRPVQIIRLPSLTTGLHTITLRGMNSQTSPGAYNPAGFIAGIRTVFTNTTLIVTDDTWTRTVTDAPDAADLVPSTTPPKGFENGIYGAAYGRWIWTDSYTFGSTSAPFNVINVFKATYTATETAGDVQFRTRDGAECSLFVNGLFIGAQADSEFRWNGIALNGGLNTFVLRCTNPIYCGSGAAGICTHDPSSSNNPASVAFQLLLGGTGRFFTSDWVSGSAATSPCNNNGLCSGWSALSHN